MAMNEALLAEYDQEIATTRKFLERVPAADADWSPHAKSKTLGALAVHVAALPWWLEAMLTTTELDLSVTSPPPPFSSLEALLGAFDRNAAAGRAALAQATDADLAVPWSLRAGAQTYFTTPRAALLRPFVFSHLVHHRAQLGVYLRLRGVPLPSSYGPTADGAA
jgi:uncharacterized damage-inducible protein DinB